MNSVMLAAVEALSFVEIALLIFVAAFVCISISLFFRRRRHYEQVASIPLQDDAPVSPRQVQSRTTQQDAGQGGDQ